MVRTPHALKCPRAMSKVEGVSPLARVKSAPSCGGWRAVGGRESSRGRVKPVNSMGVCRPLALPRTREARTLERVCAHVADAPGSLLGRSRARGSCGRKSRLRERGLWRRVGAGVPGGDLSSPRDFPRARRGVRLHASEVGVAEAGADGGAAPEGRRAQLCRAQVCAVGEETTIRRHVRRTAAH